MNTTKNENAAETISKTKEPMEQTKNANIVNQKLIKKLKFALSVAKNKKSITFLVLLSFLLSSSPLAEL